MSCFKPITAWRRADEWETGDHTLIFSNSAKVAKNKAEKLQVPCGRCIGCLLDKANDTATRCWCETQFHDRNDCCFITLTYNNKHLPENGYIKIKDEQDFWKRLRYYYPDAEIKYMGCAEYGRSENSTYRPHFHFCVWGYKPQDLVFYKYNKNGDKLYKSKELREIWGNGFVIIGELTYRSACYVARYCTKKLFKSKESKEIIKKLNIKPECTLWSKSIGLKYWEKFQKNIIQNHGIHIKIDESVKNKRIPKYFMNKYKKSDPFGYDWYMYEQSKKAEESWAKILKNTSLTKEQYMAMQERKLIEKADQLLKRTNFI